MFLVGNDGFYNDRASHLDRETRRAVREIVESAVNEDINLCEIMYIMYHAIHEEVLWCRIQKRKKERENKNGTINENRGTSR